MTAAERRALDAALRHLRAGRPGTALAILAMLIDSQVKS